jgi:predicted RNase H-like nuclease (RuvC/YqgF family)
MKHWIMLLAIVSAPLHAEIYKCIDQKGKTTFSEHPCGDSAEIITVKTTQPAHPAKSVSDYSAELEAISTRTNIRKLERRIDKLETRKRSLHRKMDAELAALRKKKLRANNNLAGAAWLASISSEMKAVSASYTTKIESTQDQIDQSQRDLEELRSR